MQHRSHSSSLFPTPAAGTLLHVDPRTLSTCLCVCVPTLFTWQWLSTSAQAPGVVRHPPVATVSASCKTPALGSPYRQEAGPLAAGELPSADVCTSGPPAIFSTGSQGPAALRHRSPRPWPLQVARPLPTGHLTPPLAPRIPWQRRAPGFSLGTASWPARPARGRWCF
jgi:hypothetical protein